MTERLCSILNCPVVDPHYHTARGTEFSRMELIEVLAERDALLSIANSRLETIEKLKAELEEAKKEIDEMQEPMSCNHAQAEMQPSDEGQDICVACYLQRGLEEDRDAWKSKAEKLAGALRFLRDYTYTDAEGPELRSQNQRCHTMAKAALAEFEKLEADWRI